jgi:hypothetical protein
LALAIAALVIAGVVGVSAGSGASAATDLKGVTVSAAQHPGGAPIDWAKVAVAGYKFAAIETTAGTNYVNPYYRDDAAAAAAAGLDVLPYLIAYPYSTGGTVDDDADAQYDFAVNKSAFHASPATLPLAVVLENDPHVATDHTNACYGSTPAEILQWLSDFGTIEQQYPALGPLVIATTPQWWDACTDDATPLNGLLWLTGNTTTLPTGWTSWAFRQYTSTATVPGISPAGHTALSYYAGTSLAGLVQQATGKQTVTFTGVRSQRSTVGASVFVGLSFGSTQGFPSFWATGLPPGVTMTTDNSAQISGWPTATGTYHVTVHAAFPSGDAGSTSFTWTVTAAANNGPLGTIVDYHGGRCLDDPSGKTANGTPADISGCDRKANQQWRMDADGTIRVSGRCLQEAGTGNGAAVVLEGCTESSAQRWQISTGAEIVNVASGRCLDDPSGKTANGTRVNVAPCEGKSYERWTGPAAPVASQFAGQCLSETGGRAVNGAVLDITGCNGNSNQKWTAEPDDTIRQGGLCAEAGTQVKLRPCNGAAAEHWAVLPQGSTGSELTSSSRACLDTSGGNSVAGTKIVTDACQPWWEEALGQAWHVQ